MKNIIFGSYTLESDGENKSAGIYTGTFDPNTGKISIEHQESHSCNPSFLCVSPDRKYLVAVNEVGSDGSLDSYLLQEDGSLKWLEKQLIPGSACCHVEYAGNGKFVTGTNYGDGSVFSYQLDENGHFNGCSSFVQHSGCGPVMDRQEHAHAHSMKSFPGDNFAIACDLGADRLLLYGYDEVGVLTPYEKQPFIETPAGFGPRHMEFSADAHYLYVVGELSNQVLVYEYDGSVFREIQIISTLPADFTEYNLSADIHLHPNGRWLYVSNRGHDSIVQYEVADNGMLQLAGHDSCDGQGPRNFAVCEEYLICTNQNSNSVSVFSLDASGGLDRITDTCSISAPTFVMLLEKD